jgi:hypothetical protein
MTRREQFIKSRAWLKTQSFVTTHSLREKLDSVPAEMRSGLCYIQNLVLVFTDEYEGKYAPIPSSMWKNKLGTKYTAFLEQLKQWGELDVDLDYRWSLDKSGYPRSYAVPAKALETGTCIVDFERQRIRFPRPKKRPTNAVSEYAFGCLSKLGVNKTLTFPLPQDPFKNPDVRRARIQWHVEHIAGGEFSLKYGRNVKRLYHGVLLMPKEGRCNLTYWCQLAEYDVKTCHPFLMLSLFTDPNERAEYAAMLARDIYSVIAKEMGIEHRKQVKADFQRVVNISHKTADWMAKQYVFQFYYEHFPIFAVNVLFKRKDLAACLQNFEASLMVHKLGMFCRERNLFWIPMHDGFIARQDQGTVIESEAKRIIRDAIGLVPQLECHPVGTVDLNYYRSGSSSSSSRCF